MSRSRRLANNRHADYQSYDVISVRAKSSTHATIVFRVPLDPAMTGILFECPVSGFRFAMTLPLKPVQP